jgi:hypothetical protein
MTTPTLSPDITLVQFFELDNAKARKEGLNALYGTASMRSVQALLTSAPSLLQNHVAQSVTEALQEALAVKVVDVLTAAWSSRRELAQYLERSKFPRDEIVDHALGKHEIFSSHKPRLQIMLDNSPMGSEFEFDIAVKLNLDAATLRVKDGRIMLARLGSVTGGGTIKCENATLFARAVTPLALPQTLSFGSGSPIVRPKEKEIALASAVDAA